MIRNGNMTIDTIAERITIGEYAHQFHKRSGTLRFRLFQHLLLSSSGMTDAEMFDDLYKDDPDGGPLYGAHVIQIFIAQAREQGIFDRLNIELHKAKVAGTMRYWARPKCE